MYDQECIETYIFLFIYIYLHTIIQAGPCIGFFARRNCYLNRVLTERADELCSTPQGSRVWLVVWGKQAGDRCSTVNSNVLIQYRQRCCLHTLTTFQNKVEHNEEYEELNIIFLFHYLFMPPPHTGAVEHICIFHSIHSMLGFR